MTPAEAQVELDRRAALLLLSGELLGQHPGLALLRDVLDRWDDTVNEVRGAWINLAQWKDLPHVPGLILGRFGVMQKLGADGYANRMKASEAALHIFQQINESPVHVIEVLDAIEQYIAELHNA